MTKIFGLAGLRPGDDGADAVTCPPYDVIKPGTSLERILRDNPRSLYHVILGEDPGSALEKLIRDSVLIRDDEPAYYVYEQLYDGQRRLGFFAAPQVTPYEAKEIIRHEKTFDEKVQGRIKLMEDTGYVTEPIWLLTAAPVIDVLEEICAEKAPLYEFVSDFRGESELSGIQNRVFKEAENSARGKKLTEIVEREPLYIADGHHRYHSALRMGLDRCIAYICSAGQAKIQAYNRVIKGEVAFEAVSEKIGAELCPTFETPERHAFMVYTAKGNWRFKARNVDEGDVIKRLDCHIVEDTLYPLLGLRHDMVMDSRYFDYYPQQDIDRMKKIVDEGVYEMAIALHPVSSEELMAVADAGIDDPDVVMPEKSTFFAPKILSGLILIPTDTTRM